MSAFVIITISKQNLDFEKLLSNLTDLSDGLGVGIFYKNRYYEPFENEINSCFSISVSDSLEFDNCEMLMTPWWYVGNNETHFTNNMFKIKCLLDMCLQYSNTLDLWIGTSGDTLSDFDYCSIYPNQFISDIKIRYQKNSQNLPPPSIHYHIKND